MVIHNDILSLASVLFFVVILDHLHSFYCPLFTPKGESLMTVVMDATNDFSTKISKNNGNSCKPKHREEGRRTGIFGSEQ
jgi:hypothetical protein